MKNVSDKINVERLTPWNGNYFFGYYDITPESPDGTKILVNRAKFIDHMPGIGEVLEVGFIDLKTMKYNLIGETNAWNFQEGCRLQWLDNDRCIYNVRGEDGFRSIVYDTKKSAVVRKYEVPIYGISKAVKRNGKEERYATFYSFTNNKYDYAHTDEEHDKDTYKDGVYLLNLNNGKYRKVVSNKKLDELCGLELSNGAPEYCVFNDEGDAFYIYYRWNEENGAMHTMLCVSDLDGNVTKLLNSNFISHAGWCGNGKISAWCRIPSKRNAIQNSSFLKSTGLWKMDVDRYLSGSRRLSAFIDV